MNIRLKEVLREKRISGKELAAMLGTTPQYISNIANGRQEMSLKSIDRIAECIGVQPWELLVSREEVCGAAPVPGDSDFVAMLHYKGQCLYFTSIDEARRCLESWG